jgi:hypothetical protein
MHCVQERGENIVVVVDFENGRKQDSNVISAHLHAAAVEQHCQGKPAANLHLQQR